MASLVLILWVFLSLGHVVYKPCSAYIGDSLVTTIHEERSPCGDWTVYSSEKCVKIFDIGPVDIEKAEAVCRDVGPEDHSRLVTIKTMQEQQFLSEFVFEKNKVVDNVWLGIKPKGSTTEHQWVDKSALSFSNWAEGANTLNQEIVCAQMETGFEESRHPGVWSWAPCNSSNIVVCEKFQLWSLKTLQKQVLHLKKSFSDVTDKLKKEMEVLRQSQSVPIGYVYIQLSYQLPPTDLWPNIMWKDVSAMYAGLFFRVKGGTAAEFGETQLENSPRLTSVKYEQGYDGNPVTIAANGSWSARIYSGSDKGAHWGLRFIVSDGEVRPRNQAVRVWQRIK